MLSVYKASAGSGKTFTLTREYIRMLLRDKQYDHQRLPHSRILAVTFTKKSTAEMKERILRELYILANDPQRSEYINDFLSDATLALDIQQIQQRSQHLLIGILQDYSRFSVSTIDGFFQQVIRSFARELGLSATYDIALDSEEIVQQAVDDIFKRIRDAKKNEDLRTWIIEYAQNNIDKDQYWNPSQRVKEFSSELLKERLMRRMRAIQDAFANKELMRQYMAQLIQISQQAEQQVSTLLEQAKAIFASEQGWSNFFQKAFDNKTPKEWLYGDIGNTFPKVLNDPSVAYTKAGSKAKRQQLADISVNQLLPICQQLHEIYTGPVARDYITAQAIIPHIYKLGILQDVDKQIQDTDQEEGRFPISKTNQLVNQIIDQQEAPFIYERVGQYYHHYMIDEFQDTSALQWENFAPLIHETEDANKDNLIVGDVKQSIYRFRNSDWHLLNEAPNQFHNIQLPRMEQNWRTAPVVVHENEKLLQRYSAWIADQIDTRTGQTEFSQDIRKMYSMDEMHQEAMKKYHGYFHLQFFEGKNAKKDSLEALDQLLQSLLAEGIDLQRVTILVAKNHEATNIANFLVQRNYSVQSKMGLKVGAHPAVKVIINLLYDDWHHATSIAQNAVLQFYGKLTPEQQDSILLAAKKPLYEKVQTIIKELQLQQMDGAVPYITAFQDIIYQFSKKRVADAKAFLEYWDKKGEKFTIPVSKISNTIQITTIHNSKGLEFDIVIIPMLSWRATSINNDNIIWCEPQTAPFNTLPLVAVTPKNILMNSHLRNDFIQEMISEYIDNLNLTYVAFTRPRYRLYAMGEKYSVNKKNSISIQNIGQLLSYLYDINDELNDQLIYAKMHDGDTAIAPLPPLKEETTHTIPATYVCEDINDRLILRSRAEDDFAEDEPLSAVNIGILMHLWLSYIHTWQDAEAALKRLIITGEVTHKQAEEMRQQLQDLQQLIHRENHDDWFTDTYRVIAEQDIITPSGNMMRPDRVMIKGTHAVIIDYKFGHEQTKAHLEQVRDYMSMLQQMGYTTEGHIIYVARNNILTIQ